MQHHKPPPLRGTDPPHNTPQKQSAEDEKDAPLPPPQLFPVRVSSLTNLRVAKGEISPAAAAWASVMKNSNIADIPAGNQSAMVGTAAKQSTPMAGESEHVSIALKSSRDPSIQNVSCGVNDKVPTWQRDFAHCASISASETGSPVPRKDDARPFFAHMATRRSATPIAIPSDVTTEAARMRGHPDAQFRASLEKLASRNNRYEHRARMAAEQLSGSPNAFAGVTSPPTTPLQTPPYGNPVSRKAALALRSKESIQSLQSIAASMTIPSDKSSTVDHSPDNVFAAQQQSQARRNRTLRIMPSDNQMQKTMQVTLGFNRPLQGVVDSLGSDAGSVATTPAASIPDVRTGSDSWALVTGSPPSTPAPPAVRPSFPTRQSQESAQSLEQGLSLAERYLRWKGKKHKKHRRSSSFSFNIAEVDGFDAITPAELNSIEGDPPKNRFLCIKSAHMPVSTMLSVENLIGGNNNSKDVAGNEVRVTLRSALREYDLSTCHPIVADYLSQIQVIATLCKKLDYIFARLELRAVYPSASEFLHDQVITVIENCRNITGLGRDENKGGDKEEVKESAALQQVSNLRGTLMILYVGTTTAQHSFGEDIVGFDAEDSDATSPEIKTYMARMMRMCEIDSKRKERTPEAETETKAVRGRQSSGSNESHRRPSTSTSTSTRPWDRDKPKNARLSATSRVSTTHTTRDEYGPSLSQRYDAHRAAFYHREDRREEYRDEPRSNYHDRDYTRDYYNREYSRTGYRYSHDPYQRDYYPRDYYRSHTPIYYHPSRPYGRIYPRDYDRDYYSGRADERHDHYRARDYYSHRDYDRYHYYNYYPAHNYYHWRNRSDEDHEYHRYLQYYYRRHMDYEASRPRRVSDAAQSGNRDSSRSQTLPRQRTDNGHHESYRSSDSYKDADDEFEPVQAALRGLACRLNGGADGLTAKERKELRAQIVAVKEQIVQVWRENVDLAGKVRALEGSE